MAERLDCIADFTDGQDCIYAVTYAGAPHGKVVRTSLERPDWSRAETVVPETADTIEYTTRSKSYLFIVSNNGLTGQIRKMNLTSGRIEVIPLPVACAEYLSKHGYTRSDRLACTGRSAGGIPVSRAITERPDLFAAADCNVGCANAMGMEFSPNGPGNTPEFGTVQDPVECSALFAMDGVQHVHAGVKYPAVLGVAGWNDPRVAPWEPGHPGFQPH